MRPHRWLLTLVSRLVPKETRADWRAEWIGELDRRERTRAAWSRRRATLALLRQTSGAFWDALFLQSTRWYTMRLFGRHWRLALSAVLSLAVGIAATAMGLSAYNALLLRSPAVADPATLQFIHIRTADDPYGAASYPEFLEYRARATAFEDIAAFPYSVSSSTFGDRTDPVVATNVSPTFFPVLGIKPRIGTLSFQDPAAGANEIVISERLWKTLGGTPAVLGREVRFNDHLVRIVGVVPAGYAGMAMTWAFDPDVWLSLEANHAVYSGDAPRTEFTDRKQEWLHMIGRLRPGVTTMQAATDVQLVAASIARDHPDAGAHRTAAVTPPSVTPPGGRRGTMVLLGSLLLVMTLALVVACTNVTNLLLGLTASRRHEMLVRAALGASRLQLTLPLIRESAVLGMTAGVLGYGTAWVTLTRLAAFHPSLGAFLPSITVDIRPDAFVLVVTMTVALVAGVGVGLAPALRGAAEGLSGSLVREQSIAEPRKSRLRGLLIVVQVGIATMVLVGGGLSIESFWKMRDPQLGFSHRHLSFTGINLRRSGFDEKTSPAFEERIREQLARKPGIEAVAFTSDVLMLGYNTDHVVAEGTPLPSDGHGAEAPYSIVDGAYFSTIGLRVLEGRVFDARDTAGRTEVVVINRTLARHHWPDADPIGRRLRIENGNRLVEVIGVVEDAKYGDVDEDQLPFMYFSLAQHYLPDVNVVARTALPRDTVMIALTDLQPNIAFGGAGVLTLDDTLRLSLMLYRIVATITMIFGVVTLGLAAFGLYSTVFYAVSQRQTEMGIRTTLGATPRDLFTLVLRDTGWRACTGAAVGLGLGLAIVPLASSIFYGIGSVEPLVIAGVAVMTALFVLATTYLVARPWTRRTAIDLLRR